MEALPILDRHFHLEVSRVLEPEACCPRQGQGYSELVVPCLRQALDLKPVDYSRHPMMGADCWQLVQDFLKALAHHQQLEVATEQAESFHYHPKIHHWEYFRQPFRYPFQTEQELPGQDLLDPVWEPELVQVECCPQ